jgi:hypothetical protein
MPFNAARSLTLPLRLAQDRDLRARVGGLASASVAGVQGCGSRYVLEYRAAEGVWRRQVLPACCGEWFEDAPPVRPFHFPDLVSADTYPETISSAADALNRSHRPP